MCGFHISDKVIWWTAWLAACAAICIALAGQWAGPGPAAPAAVRVAPQQDAVATATFRQFALQALLATLTDDDVPPRWSDEALHHLCGPQTHVEVDGQPLVPGAVVPATAFTVRWTIDQCVPFESSLGLSGVVEVQAFHDDEGLSAVVDARQLRIAGQSGSGQGPAPFAATLSRVHGVTWP